jgi:hypothetical protein
MELKFQIDNDGNGYAALIDPSTKEHRKSVALSLGQEVVISLPGVTDASEVTFSDVAVIESPPQTGEQPAEPEGEPPAPEGGEAPADDAQDGAEGGGEEAQGGEEPTTSAASEKPLYLVDGDTIPEGFVLSGLETPDGKTLYHYESDTAGQAATGNTDGVNVYADDNEQPVQAAQEAPAA